MSARLSSLPGWRPRIEHPFRLPKAYHRGQPRTALSLERDQYGRPFRAIDVPVRARGFVARLRAQLSRLRGALARLRDRFRGRRTPPVRGRRLPVTRTSIGAGRAGGGDRVITALVLATTIGLGLDLISPRKAVAIEAPEPVMSAMAVSAALDDRIDEMAHAIAVAEGYFADGPHDGRTLPYRLNNPGALKKPAKGAADLPTWKDTGLVWFPTADIGWDALRHQVRLMLTGTSGVYEHSDSLTTVGDKYADGDANWGVNVATRLGVTPARTLAELAPRE
jgi:hypothetical protein